MTRVNIKKFSLTNLTIFVFLLLLVASCMPKETKTVKRKNSPGIKKEINLITPKLGSVFPLDTIILFTLEHKKDHLIDSILLEGDGKSKTFTGNRFEWQPERFRTGNPQISLTAYFKDKKEKIYPKITFVSNLNPTRYTYEVVKHIRTMKNHIPKDSFLKMNTYMKVRDIEDPQPLENMI